MKKKRLRIIAGPNGSGKSTIIKKFPINQRDKKIELGYYVNADDIEETLKNEFCLSIKRFGLSFDTKTIQHYFKTSTFSPVKLKNENIWKIFKVIDDVLYIDKSFSMNSYIAADIAEFLRRNLR